MLHEWPFNSLYKAVVLGDVLLHVSFDLYASLQLWG
jgi:hypothetical protein